MARYRPYHSQEVVQKYELHFAHRLMSGASAAAYAYVHFIQACNFAVGKCHYSLNSTRIRPTPKMLIGGNAYIRIHSLVMDYTFFAQLSPTIFIEKFTGCSCRRHNKHCDETTAWVTSPVADTSAHYSAACRITSPAAAAATGAPCPLIKLNASRRVARQASVML